LPDAAEAPRAFDAGEAQRRPPATTLSAATVVRFDGEPALIGQSATLPHMDRRKRRRWKRALVCASVVVVLFLVLSAVLFVWPTTDTPRKVDAIVVLGGTNAALVKGLQLASEGYAPTLVVSTEYPSVCRYSMPRVSVICFRPSPATTQGEARYVGDEATKHHWNQIIVVPSTAQTLRARLYFGRCYHGSALFDPAGPVSLYDVMYEWGALAKAFTVERGC
jgi:uncharacterized SAM-binding protein YcdF (DUF218 family)